MIVRSIDVGYGNTKFCYGREKDQPARCDHFPSIATLSLGKDFGGGVMVKRDLVEVCADGSRYLVGKDVADTLSAQDDTGRILGRDYTETPQHLALFRGALAYMREPQIDLLVTGLPVNFFKQHKDRMIARLSGVHEGGDGGKIQIKSLWVIPQPIGGFVDYTLSNNRFSELSDSKCLVVDVGFFTVDWLVCHGLKLQDERSGSTPGGMSQILGRLAHLVSEDRGEPFENINLLDAGVRNGFRMRLYGKSYDFGHLLQKVEPQISRTVRVVMSSVGSLQDIDIVVLVGGGALCYADSLRAVCGDIEMVVPDDGIHANVRGFYLAGEERMKKYGY